MVDTYFAQPIGVQRSRAKGSRLPAGTVCVDRSTKYGNPYKVSRNPNGGWMVVGPVGTIACLDDKIGASRVAVDAFTTMLKTRPAGIIHYPSDDQIRAELRGHGLACWCPVWDKTTRCPECAGLGMILDPAQFISGPPCVACEGTGFARYPCHRWPLMELANA
ncbi:MAG: DUF4326 domain-containing protein [Propionibacteriaceae bacterium]|nr:DUF4326 domain-containing protein [Propionibacteriaceae bacterium]